MSCTGTRNCDPGGSGRCRCCRDEESKPGLPAPACASRVAPDIGGGGFRLRYAAIAVAKCGALGPPLLHAHALTLSFRAGPRGRRRAGYRRAGCRRRGVSRADEHVTVWPRPPRAQDRSRSADARSLASIKALRLEKRLPIDRALESERDRHHREEFTPSRRPRRRGSEAHIRQPGVRGRGGGVLRTRRIEAGDAVAIGGSGSFPAFVLASLCAARALDLRPF